MRIRDELRFDITNSLINFEELQKKCQETENASIRFIFE